MKDLKALALDDQASGLRKMFGTPAAHAIAFVSGREACGRTTLLVQTAAALANIGHGVLIFDENAGMGNQLSAFGLSPRHDLLDFIQGARSAQQVVQLAAPMIRIVAASRFAAELNYVDAEVADRLDTGLRQMQHGAEFVLVDCARSRTGHLSPLALAANHMAVVVEAESSAITQAYALIKRLFHERGRDGFQVVITRARTNEDALAIFDNLRTTAKAHLGVRLDFLGSSRVPTTDHIAASLKNRLPLLVDQNNVEVRGGSSGFGSFVAAHTIRPAAREAALQAGRSGRRAASVAPIIGGIVRPF